jgi:hypothetical protein
MPGAILVSRNCKVVAGTISLIREKSLFTNSLLTSVAEMGVQQIAALGTSTTVTGGAPDVACSNQVFMSRLYWLVTGSNGSAPI